MFHGWSSLGLFVSCLGASGGLLVALAVKHSDAIMKCVSVSFAIILTSISGWLFLGETMTFQTLIGSLVVVIGVFNYNEETLGETYNKST
eukprot:UN10846